MCFHAHCHCQNIFGGCAKFCAYCISFFCKHVCNVILTLSICLLYQSLAAKKDNSKSGGLGPIVGGSVAALVLLSAAIITTTAVVVIIYKQRFCTYIQNTLCSAFRAYCVSLHEMYRLSTHTIKYKNICLFCRRPYVGLKNDFGDYNDDIKEMKGTCMHTHINTFKLKIHFCFSLYLQMNGYEEALATV